MWAVPTWTPIKRTESIHNQWAKCMLCGFLCFHQAVCGVLSWHADHVAGNFLSMSWTSFMYVIAILFWCSWHTQQNSRFRNSLLYCCHVFSRKRAFFNFILTSCLTAEFWARLWSSSPLLWSAYTSSEYNAGSAAWLESELAILSLVSFLAPVWEWVGPSSTTSSYGAAVTSAATSSESFSLHSDLYCMVHQHSSDRYLNTDLAVAPLSMATPGMLAL